MQINDVTKLFANIFPVAETPKVKEITPRPEEGKNPQLSALQVGKEERDKNYEKRGRKKRKDAAGEDDKDKEGTTTAGGGGKVDLIV